MDGSLPPVDGNLLFSVCAAQSDREKAEGLPVAPFMDREKVTKPTAQIGFIKFVLIPMFETVMKVNVQDSDDSNDEGQTNGYKVGRATGSLWISYFNAIFGIDQLISMYNTTLMIWFGTHWSIISTVAEKELNTTIPMSISCNCYGEESELYQIQNALSHSREQNNVAKLISLETKDVSETSGGK